MNIQFIQDFTVVLLVAGLSGAICRRLGASVTIGYLLAGMVVGPYTPPVDMVADIASIQTLSQLGLIFLMFSTGMSLSLRKIGQLGMNLVVSVLCSSLFIIMILRIGGGLSHVGVLTVLFIAGMLVSSSSAIISRILHDGGLIHRHAGRLAMTYTLLEDLSAMILFSIVGAYAAAEKVLLVRETGAFFAFLVLAVTTALLLVPRFLSAIQRSLQMELQTLLVAGLLCLLAVLATRAGYSPALGAFLLGLIIAGTRQRKVIERSFSGLRDIFSAVFFVSIGMLIDVHVFLDPRFLLILPLLAAGAVIIRLISVTAGMFLAGYKGRVVFPAALTLTATGEFSFIFAQLGVSRGVLPEYSQALSVGVCVLTAAFASFAVPRGERISALLMAHQPRLLSRAIGGWQNFLEILRRRRQAGMLWRYARKRVAQIGLEILLVTGMLIFAEPLYLRVLKVCEHHQLQGSVAALVFWTVFGFFLLLPIIAIWRNIGALALLYAQAAEQDESRPGHRSVLVEKLIKLVAIAFLTGWLWMFWPMHVVPIWVPAILFAILGIMSILFWRKMIFWHSVLEGRIYSAFRGEEHDQMRDWRGKTAEWNVELAECVIPDYSYHGGRSIADLAVRTRFSCTIIAIERQGFLIMNPSASALVYPQDNILLLGTAENITGARQWLAGGTSLPVEDVHVEDIHFETIVVPDDSPRLGQTLRQMEIAGTFGVQIAGIQRIEVGHVNPTATEILQAGDEILLLGLSSQISTFSSWLSQNKLN